MAREEALKIGKVIADNWWANSRPIILSKQHMENELSTLDQYLTDPSWGKSNIKETNNRKIRRNLLTDEELACDQDDLGNFVSIWDHVYLIHLSRKSKKPEYIYVIEDGLIDALEEYDRDNLIDISYYGPGKKYIAEMEAEFDE